MNTSFLEITLFLDEDAMYKSKPQHEHILHYLMQHNISGATVFTGAIGFGRSHRLHKPGLLGSTDPRPLMLIFVDEEAKVRAVLPHIKEVMKNSLIIMKQVERV